LAAPGPGDGQGEKVKGRLAKLDLSTPQGVQTQPPANKRTVVVKEGDSLSTIARRNKVKITELRKVNRISGNMIKPGQKLVIP
jgi:LysM repeat protein